MVRLMVHQFHQELQRFLDLLFPPHCAGCQCSGHLLCSPCRQKIQPLASPRCQHCNGPLSPTGSCQQCRYHLLRLSGLRAASLYQEPLRSCIHSLKYQGSTRLAEPLGLLLAEVYLTSGIQADIITPVPLHHERQRQRGFNQARLLAEVCAARLDIPLQDTLLIRSRPTLAQVQLPANQRQRNVAGAFLCTPTLPAGALRGRQLVLIDDVCTTGATLEACAAPLFAAGARSVWGLVLARPT